MNQLQKFKLDELIPFLVFIFIALINLANSLIKKQRKGKDSPVLPAEPQPKPGPSRFKTFLEEIAEVFEPERSPIPGEWPEGLEASDNQEEVIEAPPHRPNGIKVEEPFPTVSEPAAAVRKRAPDRPPVRAEGSEPIRTTKTVISSVSSAFLLIKGMRLVPNLMIRTGDSGKIHFSLKNRAELRKAIIADNVFSPPRALEASFRSTIVS